MHITLMVRLGTPSLGTEKEQLLPHNLVPRALAMLEQKRPCMTKGPGDEVGSPSVRQDRNRSFTP